ncbi:MAG: hypothetical protein ACI4EG_12980 [Fusicatenibacter sp.]
MAFKDEDMTYAVVEYARTHPSGKLVWKSIVEWIHEKKTRDKDSRLESLVGIKDYQFYRPVKRKGKRGKSVSTYRDCKIRFDMINEGRAYVSDTRMPKLMSAAPEEFLALPYAKQREAIVEMQNMCRKLYADLGEADARAQRNRIDEEYINGIEQRIENIDIVIQKNLQKYSRQLNYIMRVLNEREAREEMEQYGITAEGIDRNRIMDILEDQGRKLYSIKDDVNRFRKLCMENVNDEKGGVEIPKKNGNVISWSSFNESLLDDDEEDDDDE